MLDIFWNSSSQKDDFEAQLSLSTIIFLSEERPVLIYKRSFFCIKLVMVTDRLGNLWLGVGGKQLNQRHLTTHIHIRIGSSVSKQGMERG